MSSYQWASAQAKRRFREDLLERDGDCCFFCGWKLAFQVPQYHPDEPTIEHLVERVHGGGNGLLNLCLAHRKCNEARKEMYLAEKAQTFGMTPGQVDRFRRENGMYDRFRLDPWRLPL